MLGQTIAQGELIGLQIGKIADLIIPSNRASEAIRVVPSAINKQSCPGPARLTLTGFEGDQQADLKNHGGIDKAVLAYSADHLKAWSERVGREVTPGCFGENLTISGLDESSVCVGDEIEIGDAILQVSQPRQPCFKLAALWKENLMIKWVVNSGFTGWYFRVLKSGTIAQSMPVRIAARPNPEWTIQRANRLMYGQLVDHEAVAELLILPQLSLAWKESLG